MPEYLYTDEESHTVTVTHPMIYSTGIVCAACGLEMWRKPQAFTVTWGGLAPSQGEMSNPIRRHLASVPEKRDKFAEKHEEHERRTANEN